jgi:hypothetical protein
VNRFESEGLEVERRDQVEWVIRMMPVSIQIEIFLSLGREEAALRRVVSHVEALEEGRRWEVRKLCGLKVF